MSEPKQREQHRLLVICRADAVWRRLEILTKLYAVVRVSAEDEAATALREAQIDLALVSAADLGEERAGRLITRVRAIEPALPILLLTPSSWRDTAQLPKGIQRLSQGSMASEAGRAALALVIERAISERQAALAERYGQRGQRRAAQSARRLLIGESETALALRDEIERAAASELNLLITGETGVGKSMAAEVVHASSRRAPRPLVVVEPTTLPSSLFESELFGHVRGAFTGAASSEIGAFEAADGGTLFLDEIGDLPTFLQIKLLRAVESKIIRRIGDTREVHLDVRVITATNRDLEAQVAGEAFRDDLFHRLNEIRLHIPPLRERCDDILPLLQSFLSSLRDPDAAPLPLDAASAERLRAHDWPGNVRELRTLARRLIERGLPERLDESGLLPIFPARVDRGMESDGGPEERIRIFRRRVYLEELTRHGFDICAAASALDIPYATLRSRLAALDLLELIKERRQGSRA